MFGLDDWLAGFTGPGGSGAMALLVALLLGLRHATDPDHLTALSTLVLSDQQHGTRRAGVLGAWWGLGHATTLFLFGLPVILFRRYLPPLFQSVAEATIGAVILFLAVRLLLRWKRGAFHSHPHTHEGREHSHPHAHELRRAGDHPAEHGHRHAEALGRSPLAAFGIGLLHGAGGSAAVGVLLVGAVSGRAQGVIALFLFAAATALSMALVSTAFGYALVRGPMARRLESWVPVFGGAGVCFGLWYAVEALRGVAF
jgi:ABC-type nickel/cobalt efflux system permease component RcnA